MLTVMERGIPPISMGSRNRLSHWSACCSSLAAAATLALTLAPSAGGPVTAGANPAEGDAGYSKTQNVMSLANSDGVPGRLYVTNQFTVSRGGDIVDYVAGNSGDGSMLAAEYKAVETGKTTQERVKAGQRVLPWSVSIAYGLNGPQVKPSQIAGASGLVDPFSNTKLKSVWDFNTMSDILGPVDDGNGGKAYNTYRIYRKAAANASEARTSAQDGNKIFSQKNTADDALNTGLDRWEVKLFDVVNTYDSSAVHSSASGDAGTTWVGIKDAVVDSTDGSTKTKLDAYQSPAKAVLMLDVPVSDNNGGLTPEPDDGQDPCGKDGCRTIDLTVQKVWKDGNLERPQSVELKIAAHYTDGSGNTVTPQTIQCFGADCTTVTQKNPWTVTLDSSDASSWSNTWRKVIQGLPVAFVDGQDANGKDIVRYYTYTVEETAVTYKDGDTTKTIKPAEAGYQVSVSYNTKERVAIVTNAALLPDTGGAGTMWFLMFGLLLMGAGVVWYVRNQRVQSGTVRSGSSRIRKRGAHAS